MPKPQKITGKIKLGVLPGIFFMSVWNGKGGGCHKGKKWTWNLFQGNIMRSVLHQLYISSVLMFSFVSCFSWIFQPRSRKETLIFYTRMLENNGNIFKIYFDWSKTCFCLPRPLIKL